MEGLNMSTSKKLVWDQFGEKTYETGVEKCVLYTMPAAGGYTKATAWNGVTKVNENPSGAESTPVYANNSKYLNLISAEDFAATVEAYTYPDEFAECDGSAEVVAGVTIGQQARKPFGFCYKTRIGNDTEADGHGYKIHVVYNCTASPSAKDYTTVNETPEAMNFSWEFSTTPVDVEGYKPTSTITINSTKVTAEILKKVEDALYGTTTVAASLPSLETLIALVKGSPAA